MDRRLPLSVALAVLLLNTVTPTAFAECGDWPIRATQRLDVGYAFTATVTEASRDVDPPKPDSSAFDWHVELRVEHRYRGDVPDRLVFNGWDVGCHFLRGDHLRTGDRIFIATESLHFDAARTDPFSGDVLVWHRTGARWALYTTALDQGSDKAFYPKAARTATTVTAILRLVSAAPVPDTSTLAAPDDRPGDAKIPALAFAFIAALVLALKRVSKVRPR